MMKIIGIFISAIIVIGISVGGCQKQPEEYTGPVEKITLAAYAGETGALVYVAEHQGYFKKNGLEVTIKDYESGKAAANILVAGEVDIATAADDVFISGALDHADLRVFGTVATAEVTALIARKDKGIITIDDLIGKKVGVTKNTGCEIALASFLLDNGLFINEIELVDLKPSEIVKAILDGDIDAAVTWDPNVYDIKKELGDNAISWGNIQESFYFVLITKKEWLENNPAAANRFIKAVLEAEDYVKDNSKEAKEFIKNRFDYEQDYIDYSWPKQEFAVVLEQAMLVWFESITRWRIKNNLVEATEVPNYLDYIYMDALEKVKPEAVGIIH